MGVSEFETALIEACGSFGLLLRASQIERMWRHFAMVCEANESFNLTRITDERRAAVEHYADSLTLLAWIVDRRIPLERAMDVGTGAGLPAVPLAILLPDVRWAAIDSTGKKARFVADAAARLGLENLTARHARARELAAAVDPYDLVVCRAVSKVADAIEEVRKLVRPGGCLVCYKTAHLDPSERDEGEKAARRFGFTPQPDVAVTIRQGGETYPRLLVAYQRDAKG